MGSNHFWAGLGAVKHGLGVSNEFRSGFAECGSLGLDFLRFFGVVSDGIGPGVGKVGLTFDVGEKVLYRVKTVKKRQ